MQNSTMLMLAARAWPGIIAAVVALLPWLVVKERQQRG
jgi:hypothetical protein